MGILENTENVKISAIIQKSHPQRRSVIISITNEYLE